MISEYLLRIFCTYCQVKRKNKYLDIKSYTSFIIIFKHRYGWRMCAIIRFTGQWWCIILFYDIGTWQKKKKNSDKL